MARSKTVRGEKEFDTLDRLKQENKKLKREVSSLRKALSRIDVERFEKLKELVGKQRKEDKEDVKQKKTSKNKKDRQCYQCGEGSMQLKIFDRRDGVFYYRGCTICDHRTKMKKYHKEVQE